MKPVTLPIVICCLIKYLALAPPIFLDTICIIQVTANTSIVSGILLTIIDTITTTIVTTAEMNCGRACDMNCLNVSVSLV